MRKSLFLALLFAFALPFTAPKAQAQFSLLPYLGYNLEGDFGGFLVGIGAEIDAPFAIGDLALAIQPGIEYTFTEDPSDDVSFSYFQVDANVIARLGAPGAPIAPFAGAGLAVGIFSVDSDIDTDFGDFGFSSSDTEFGLNLVGGVEFPGAVAFGTPFARGRFTLISDASALSIMGGLRVPLGAQ